MIRLISQITGSVKYAHNEVGILDKVESDFSELSGKLAEQVEIEFLPTYIEDAADNVILGTWIIRNVAYKYGYIATFFPKLETGHAGNGFHIHMALNKDGKNIMTKKGGDLTDQAHKLIGGLCRYAPSLTAFGNMVSASYLRLVPNQEAPTKVSWSDSNRSALIRVPLAWSNVSNLTKKINPQQIDELPYDSARQTVELRSPDGSANVHLLMAGITMSADWGLSNAKHSTELALKSRIQSPQQANDNNSEVEDLASSCTESAEMLLSQRKLYERDNVFPHQVINYVTKLLQSENDRYLNSRLLSLPDEEQLVESRRIMHRDIHRC
jgi:glutamine synthetase